MSNSKQWLIMISGGGENPALAFKGGLDLALAAGAMGQHVSLAFSGQGLDLLHASPNQVSDTYRLLGSAPFYDIKQIYAVYEGEATLPLRTDIPIALMSAHAWQAAIASHDVVVNY